MYTNADTRVHILICVFEKETNANKMLFFNYTLLIIIQTYIICAGSRHYLLVFYLHKMHNRNFRQVTLYLYFVISYLLMRFY